MLDVRRLVRGVALQLLYELDTTTHPPETVLQFRNVSTVKGYDVHLQGYAALRWCLENKPETPIISTFELPVTLPPDQRTSIDQILIDYLTENIEREDLRDDMIAEIEHEIIQPDSDEFEQELQSPEDILSTAHYRSVYQLVQGVLINREQLDRIIHRYATEYPIDQLAVIDRNLIRIAIFEYGISGDTPFRVAINEAVEMAHIYGSDSSTSFVNGVLGSISAHYSEIKDELQDIKKNYRKVLEGA